MVSQVDEYLESKVMTAQPHQLHLMVVEGAIRSATRAEEALKVKDFETSHFSLNEARGLVTELVSGLNEEHAPELVDNLKALFVFIYRNLVDADRDQDVTKIQDALKILRMHHETWLELIDKLKQESGASGSHDTASKTRSWTS